MMKLIVYQVKEKYVEEYMSTEGENIDIEIENNAVVVKIGLPDKLEKIGIFPSDKFVFELITNFQ